jgi:hemerythrin
LSSTQALNDLLGYLNEWLIRHIINQDKDYTRWLLSKED